MAVAEEIDDERKIDFPGPLMSGQVRDLVAYLAKSLPNSEIELTTHKIERFGNRFPELASKAKPSIETKLLDETLLGIISKSPPPKSANMEFNVEFEYNCCGEITYTGLSFPLTPGFESGESTSDDPSLITDIRTQVRDYFSP